MTLRAHRQKGGPTSAAADSALQLSARGPVAEGPSLQLKKTANGNAAKKNPQAVAKSGFQGGGSALPHKAKIESSFGHDLGGVKAFTGPAAKAACESLGANAYAMGDKVAFKNSSPSVALAGHEAAHVVQQAKGVNLSSGMGKAGDGYEKAADQAGALAAAGQSARSVLGGGKEGGGKTGLQLKADGALQLDSADSSAEPALEKKKVSAKAMTRLGHARKAIKHVKSVLSHGAGNQKEALEATNFNSYFRMAAMRDNECWHIDPKVISWCRKYPEALTAAKADLAAGGNCGEHAAVAFDYLRQNAGGEIINKVAHTMDHAFVLIGDMSEGGDEIVACDPWPTKPTACLFEDHFGYTTDPKELTVRNTIKGNGEEVKAIILSGLSLSAKGKAYIAHAYDDAKTAEAIKIGTEGAPPSEEYPEGRKRWIWVHANAANTEYDYVPLNEVAQADPDKIEPAPDPVQDPAHAQDQGWARFLSWLRSWA